MDAYIFPATIGVTLHRVIRIVTVQVEGIRILMRIDTMHLHTQLGWE